MALTRLASASTAFWPAARSLPGSKISCWRFTSRVRESGTRPQARRASEGASGCPLAGTSALYGPEVETRMAREAIVRGSGLEDEDKKRDAALRPRLLREVIGQ